MPDTVEFAAFSPEGANKASAGWAALSVDFDPFASMPKALPLAGTGHIVGLSNTIGRGDWRYQVQKPALSEIVANQPDFVQNGSLGGSPIRTS